jgi:Domain of unknown function (DUF4159)
MRLPLAAGVFALATGGLAAGLSAQDASLSDRAFLHPLHGDPPTEFYFARAIYRSRIRGGDPRFIPWRIDYPKADRQFIIGLKRLSKLDVDDREHAVRLDDPELRRHPFLYAVEVGHMDLTDAEARGLRSYLLAGGFLVVDDFWGTLEWANFEQQLGRVIPEYPIVDISPDHPVLSSFYDIPGIIQVPNLSQGMRGGPTWERDGYEPHFRGVFDDAGRLMIAIVWNSDLGDAWEWADHPRYPLSYSTFAYEMGLNLIIYGMSH